MELVANILDFLFGCRHRNVSRVFTLGGQTYRVCCDCGVKFSYSLANMSMVRRTAAPRLRDLRHVHTS